MRLRNNKKNYGKEMKKGKLLLALLGCLLLVACQKGTKSEEQRTDVWDSTLTTVSDRIGNIETVDVELESNSDENLTTISVLGREKLMIETERIYGTESDLGYLDNRFTPEEMDIILNAIEGTWIVDEYVDFVSYENSIWSEEEGTEEIKQKKYEDAVEQAKRNLPDFSFQIKSFNSENPTGCGQYIYVYNDNESYASPMCVALSMQEEGEEYLRFMNRTSQGGKIPEQFGYPVIYIGFFSVSCSTEGTVFYEPVTLIMASDGTFLLLKDGAVYSLRNSIQSQIMGGDFSYLTNEDWESKQEVYRNLEKASAQGLEWCQLDLNGDGIEDLILQETETVASDSEEKRIIGIFNCKRDEARCILWDVNDSSEYYFYGTTGELMYAASSYGGVVSTETYSHYYFNEEWNEIKNYTLVVYCIDSKVDEEYAEEWRRENPDMAEDGIYYRKYTEEGVEVLTRKELENIYEMNTGYEFYSEFY